MLFENVAGSSMPVLINLFGTIERVAWGMNREPDELRQLGEMLAFFRQPEPPGGWRAAVEMMPHLRAALAMRPKTASRAPCQEIVLRGDEIDLRELPVLLHYEKDGGRYVTAGLQIARHPVTGQRNVSIHRMLLLDRNHLSVYAPPGRHTRAIIERNLDDGRPTEIATAIGTEPVLQIATQARVPLGVD
ncbi:MAG: UbiD family decarboxylase domain-containing protein, partial [Geminicoccaceae bacterium]